MTIKDLKALALKNIAHQQTALHGLMDALPEAMKAQMLALKAALDEQCNALSGVADGPDADPAAALEWCAACVKKTLEHSSALMEQLGALKTLLGTQATALQSFESRLTAGELVTKATAEAAVETARTAERNTAVGLIVAARKASLELAGLPLPAETVLAQPDFTDRQTQAKANLAELAKRGLKPGGKGSEFAAAHAWDTAAEFAGAMKQIADLAPAATGEPLLGGPGGNPPPEGKKRVAL